MTLKKLLNNSSNNNKKNKEENEKIKELMKDNVDIAKKLQLIEKENEDHQNEINL